MQPIAFQDATEQRVQLSNQGSEAFAERGVIGKEFRNITPQQGITVAEEPHPARFRMIHRFSH